MFLVVHEINQYKKGKHFIHWGPYYNDIFM